MAAARDGEARVRVSRGIAPIVVALLGMITVAACGESTRPATTPPPTARVVGYFTGWGIYGRDYQVKDVDTSGAAAGLSHLVYAFGKVIGGRCAVSDGWADYEKPIAAADSVDGRADSGELRGTIGQMRKLKAKHPHLKVLWSFGGWTGSKGFTDAAADPGAFAASCHRLLTDKRWAGVFDGIDVDWEYPNACGLGCDSSGPKALSSLVAALRSAFGPGALVTAAVPGDAGKLDTTDYAAAARSVDWLSAMTYDYFGTAADDGTESGVHGPTAPHSPLTAYPGIPRAGATADATITKLLDLGIPAQKVLLGLGFYGRGWAGVTDAEPGGTATGAAGGKYEKGIEDYAVLATRCPPTGTAGGTAYAHCGDQWWGYDTPETVKTKMAYAKSKSLGGAFAWELSGDTKTADLLTAMSGGLR
jgi:chitinase